MADVSLMVWGWLLFLVRLLREELQLLQEQGSYVGEVVRAMDKKKVLVKVKAACRRGQAPSAPSLSHCPQASLRESWLGWLC